MRKSKIVQKHYIGPQGKGTWISGFSGFHQGTWISDVVCLQDLIERAPSDNFMQIN